MKSIEVGDYLVVCRRAYRIRARKRPREIEQQGLPCVMSQQGKPQPPTVDLAILTPALILS